MRRSAQSPRRGVVRHRSNLHLNAAGVEVEKGCRASHRAKAAAPLTEKKGPHAPGSSYSVCWLLSLRALKPWVGA